MCMCMGMCYCDQDGDLTPPVATAGQVGSSVLLVAREGEQQPDPTGSQLAVGLPQDSSKDKGGDHYYRQCHNCGRIYNNREEYYQHTC